MSENLENSAVATGLEKGSFHSNPKFFGNAKECSNYLTFTLISQASKVMLKILQARLQQYVNHELPDVQAGFRKGRGTRDQIANIRWIIKKESSGKTSTSALLTMPKLLMCGSQQIGKFFKRWENQTTWPAYKYAGMQVKKQQLELDMEQQTGSKLGKEFTKSCIWSPCLFNFYM